MQFGVDELRHDAASLYRFVDSVCSLCDQPRDYPAYLPASEEFFKYIRLLGESAKRYLDFFPQSVPTGDPVLYEARRSKLRLLRLSWFEIHQYVKATVDADSLNVPLPFIHGVLRRLRKIRGLEKTDFTLFHIDELNYLQVRAAFFRDRAQRLRDILKGFDPPEFPRNLGTIGIPYSQASALFLNCLIPHEMGHFVFQEQDRIKDLLGDMSGAVNKVLAASISAAKAADLVWLRTTLAAWSEEIFCDLLAIWLVGPCYCFAFIELFDVTAQFDTPVSVGPYPFFPRHPADAFRMVQHVVVLKTLGWWNEVTKFTSHYARLLQAIETIPNSAFTFVSTENQQLAPYAIQAFFELVPTVHRVLKAVVGSLESGVDAFRTHDTAIEEFLRNGVVPSSIPVGDRRICPEPIALLNAAYKFYLESITTLMSQIDGQDPALAKDRARWSHRLELWITKAIEDYLLLNPEGVT